MANLDGRIRTGVQFELENAQKQVDQLGKQLVSQTKAVENRRRPRKSSEASMTSFFSIPPCPMGPGGWRKILWPRK